MYDVIVVGTGPAGSTAARECARHGLSVLQIDRAAFPRDKPCGGGVNLRIVQLLPFSIESVTERTIVWSQGCRLVRGEQTYRGLIERVGRPSIGLELTSDLVRSVPLLQRRAGMDDPPTAERFLRRKMAEGV
jgi:hypothetical protein